MDPTKQVEALIQDVNELNKAAQESARPTFARWDLIRKKIIHVQTEAYRLRHALLFPDKDLIGEMSESKESS
jgi:hypothetical protein